MSPKEIDRLEVIQRLEAGIIQQQEAALLLHLSVRQVKRLCRAFRLGGAAGLVSRRRGRPSNHQMDPQCVQQAIGRLHSLYRDFGPTLAHEKLTEVHGLSLSVESVRQLMIREGLWRPQRAKTLPVHPLRERRACLGELVQVDGCEYYWFEDRAPACTLLVFIDDATGRFQQLHFVPRETMFGYAEAMRDYLLRHGRPLALYSDRHGIFRVNAPAATSGTGLTQFGRAMEQLDIQILCASSPQAKGRVERAHQTLQDRLVKEMRLRAIGDMDAGNAFLPQFMDDLNTRFALRPHSPHDLHRSLRPQDDVDHILCRQEERVLSKNLTLQYQRVVYQIQTTRPAYALRGAKVRVCEDATGQVQILYQDRPLAFTVHAQQARQGEVLSRKELGVAPLPQARPPHLPPPDHPWRRRGLFRRTTCTETVSEEG